MIRRHWLHRITAAVVLTIFFSMTTACYGPFNLAKTIYRWNAGVQGNGDINQKWMREIIFVALVIIPVYQISLFVDAVLFNSIQFWTGSNPIKVSQEGGDRQGLSIQAGETSARLAFGADGASAQVTYIRQGKVLTTGSIVVEGTRYRLISAAGEELSVVELNDAAGLILIDQRCQEVGRLPLPALQQAAMTWAARPARL